MAECRRWLVSGRVQGVFFRASAREVAESLGLSGSAVNLPDGRVEVVACGGPGALDRMHAWLQRGPVHARVTDLECEPFPAREFDGFSVR